MPNSALPPLPGRDLTPAPGSAARPLRAAPWRAHPRTARRAGAVAVVAGVCAAGLTSAAPSQAGINPGPALTVVASSRTATLTRWVYEDGSYTDGQIGVYAVAGHRGVQFKITRAAYDQPVKAVMVEGTGNTATTTALPDGLVTDFNGLSDMFTASLRDAKGASLGTFPIGFCPAYETVRTTMTAPETTVTSRACGGSYFSRGVLVGLAADWATPLLSWDERIQSLEPGAYSITVGFAPEWKAALGLSTGASTTVALNVVERREGSTPEPTETSSTKPGTTSTSKPGTTSTSKTGTSTGTASGSASPRALAPAARVGAESLAAAQVLPAQQEVQAQLARSGKGLRAAQRDELHRAQRLQAASARPGTAADRGGSQEILTKAQLNALGRKNLPDLIPLPAFSVAVTPFTDSERGTYGGIVGHEYLSFSATVWNNGPSPLVVDGLRTPGADTMSAYQSVYDTSGKRLGYAPTGDMAYDPRPGHEHWHFKDFAEYRLTSGEGDLAIPSEKEAFCLAPTDAIDLTIKGAQLSPDSIGLGSACGQPSSLGIREVMPVGWGDTYGQWLPGQAFDITSLPNGTYYIEVVTNASGRLLERDTSNNTSRRQVILGGTPGARTVTVPPYMGIDTEQPMEPGEGGWRFGR
ncbi:MAG: lysyl oxidase family protein [Kineosporiaceae bacterium]